jgi:hypothetical protein
MHLAWYHPDPVERRPAFPSWSWLGWRGRIVYNDGFGHLHEAKVKVNDTRAREVSTMDDTSNTIFITLRQYCANRDFLNLSSHEAPRLITMTSRMSYIRLMEKTGENVWSVRPFAGDKGRCSCSYSCSVYFDDARSHAGEPLDIVAFLLRRRDGSVDGRVYLLLQPTERQTYTRIGLLIWKLPREHMQVPYYERTVIIE